MPPKSYPPEPYQLALVTPGISPCNARVLKQIRHMPNFLRNARGLPQTRQRLYPRTSNLGLRWDFETNDFFAMSRFFKSR